MPIINISSPQPASGKTTLAINLATGLSLKGFKVLLVTMPDVNITFWLDNISNHAYKLNIINIDNLNKLPVINYDDFDYIIIDINISEVTALIPYHPVYEIICLDFSNLPLDYLTDIISSIKPAAFIAPNKVKFKEWQAVELLDNLANYVDYDYILDGIGY